MSLTQDSDIAIVGAGIVGMASCALLISQGYRVALVDPVELEPTLPAALDLRTYALTPASMRMLDKLGTGAGVDLARIAAFDGMHVWDAQSNGVIEFKALELGRPALGYMVEHANLMCALHRSLTTQAGLSRVTATLTGLTQNDDGVRLSLDTGAALSAKLVIGCDGADSAIRALISFSPTARTYDQHALVSNVEVEQAHRAIARQRFLPAGPLAFLPLPDPNLCAVVWSTTPQQAHAALAASDDTFNDMLETAFEHTLGAVRTVSERVSVPLRRIHVDHYSHGRVALLGDAAHVVHPLAGQGLNLGLMDAAALAQTLGPRDELTLKFPRAPLRRFERMRRGENLMMLMLTDQLNRLFREEHRLARRVRGTGMSAVNRIAPLKTWLMLRAMGDVGDVPAIAALGSTSQ